MVQKIPADINTSYILVANCPSARVMGRNYRGTRGQLLALIDRTNTVAGTPLADGVARAGQLLDGVSRDAIMVVISDGEESCRGNPCAVARRLSQLKPRLKINVVDINGRKLSRAAYRGSGFHSKKRR